MEQQRRRRRVSVGSESSNSGQVLALSLFLMLLAFFIVLNAISDFEETRVKPILDSLEKSFAAETIPPTDTNPSVQESESLSVDEGDVTERLEALFRSQIPTYEAATNKTKGTMHVRLPLDEFKQAVMAVGQRQTENKAGKDGQFLLKGFFLPTLIAVIRADKAEMPYRMDMILNVGDNPPHLQNDKPKIAQKHVKDMSTLATKLQNSGLPARLQSIGLGNGPEGTVDLVFRPHVAFDPTEGADE
jgi:hypothetical protein